MIKGFWKSLENWNYIDSWNVFSRSLFLFDILKENKKLVFVVDSKKELDSYSKVFTSFWLKITEVNNKSALTESIYSKSGLFIVVKEIFELNLNIYEFSRDELLNVNINEELDLEDFIKKLNDFWYTYSSYVEEGQYNKSWDLLTIKPIWANHIYKISLWWDVVEQIEDYNSTWGKIFELDNLKIWKVEDLILIPWKINTELKELLFSEWNTIVLSNLDLWDNRSEFEDSEVISFDLFNKPGYNQDNLWIDSLHIPNLEELKDLLENKSFKPHIFTSHEKAVSDFIDLNNITSVILNSWKYKWLKSFIKEKDLYICDDIISKIFIKKRVKKSVSRHMDLLLQIRQWDQVVHIDHWIWIFNWIVKKQLWKVIKDYLELEYLWDDKLFVPVSEAWRIVKYVWQENPKLTSLKWTSWQKSVKKAEKEVEYMAEELLTIYAKRELQKGYSFDIKETKIKEFQKSFGYEYTDDQKKSISEILLDMHDIKPMDRLLSWDVWFWKTEVAFNAIYNSFLNWKQSVMISPLVVLAYEHYEKAFKRFSAFWMSVDILTRLSTPKQTKATMERLKQWKLDLVIGTHKLLSDKIDIKNLWLLVLDEEHKFWVKDKEKLKIHKEKVDVLSMSATPIPRSMNMALSWIKDISTLQTAPMWRKDIKTFITKFADSIIIEACEREFERWWQVFFIHNRVDNIDAYAKHLSTLLPDKNIVVVHGQLPWDQLEDRIMAFKNKEYDILVSTTVVENGVDFTNANTIIINDAYKFWLSQIHQLRWRVWRKDRQWYCYLTYSRDKIPEDWIKRLKTLAEHSYLWAWFEIASKDLEIRGWWDILWVKQSWQTFEIWVSTYLRMLEDKIEELKEKSWEEKITLNINTTIELNIPVYVSSEYFMSELDKMNFYREAQSITNSEELDNLKKSFKDFNLHLDDNTKLFFDMLALKIEAFYKKIIWIKRIWEYYHIDFESPDADVLRSFLDMDKQTKFLVVSLSKIRAKVKNFKSDEDFLSYLLDIFWIKTKSSKKIKLKK